MAKNPGKIFEEDFKKSIPKGTFCYKLKDSAGTWQGGNNTRFTSANICDYVIFSKGWLILAELKSHKGASFPISIKKNDKEVITHYGIIKKSQLDGLIKYMNYEDIEPCFIFNLSEKEKTYWVEAGEVQKAIDEGLKSLNIEWLELHGTLIPQQKKRTRYRYDLSSLLD